MDSLDTVEIVMAIEESFDVEMENLGVDSPDAFDTPSKLVDWLEPRLSNQRPNKAAQDLLRELAENEQWPELPAGLDGPWRREQIAAIVREIFRRCGRN